MAIEIIRPTSAYNPGAWSNPGNLWDNNLSTLASVTDPNLSPDLSVGGDAAGEATNAWGAKSNPWTAATIFCRYERTGFTAGDDDTITLRYGYWSGGVYNNLADWVASTTADVTINTFSAALSTAQFGTNFDNIAIARVQHVSSRAMGPDGRTSNMYEVWIEGTYTPSATLIIPQTMVMN